MNDELTPELRTRLADLRAGRGAAKDPKAADALARALRELGTPAGRRAALEVYAHLLRVAPWWVDAFNASVQAEHLGDDAAVERYLLRARRLEPSLKVLHRLCSVLRRQGKLDAALAFAEEMARRFPEEASAALGLAQVFEARGELARSETVLRAAARRLGEDALVDARSYCFRERAREEARAGRAEAARALLEESARLRPEADTFLRVGLVLELELHDPERGERWLRRAHEADPTNRWVRRELGRMLSARGVFDEALALLAAAFEEAPADGNGAHHYSIALAATLRFAESERACFVHLEQASSPVDGLHRLGHLYEVAGRLDDAERAWRAAVEADRGGFTKLHLDLARLFIAQGRLADADATLAEGWARDPDCRACAEGRARLLVARGQAEAARAVIDALLEAKPDDAGLQVVASEQALARGDVREALRHAEAARALNPPFGIAASPLGRALLAAGRSEEALPQLRAAVAHDADLVPARHDDLVRALEALGAEAEAARARAAGQAFAQALTEASGSLRGLDAARWTTPPPASPSRASPPPPRVGGRAPAAVDYALLLLERLAASEAARQRLDQQTPEVDFETLGQRLGRRFDEPVLVSGSVTGAVDARVDELFAMDPASPGRAALPVRLDVRELTRGRHATDELEVATERLRLAGLAALRDAPDRAADRELCRLPPLRRRVWELGGGGLAVVGYAGLEPVAVLAAHGVGGAGLPDAYDLRELTYVDLADAGLDAFPEQLLGCPELRYLRLSGNPLGAVPERVAALRALRVLEVVNAGLSEEAVSRLEAWLPDCEVRAR